MINEILLEILKNKIEKQEVSIDDIKDNNYKEVIKKWLEEN